MTKQLLLVSLSVAWVAALLCVTEVLSAGTCEPDCTGKDPLDEVPDPLNCTRYYICIDDNLPSDAPVSCPAGSFFDPAVTPGCTGSGPCDPSCALSPCHLTCSSDLDKISDPKSCSNYYYCLGNSAVGPFECPANLPYFDGSSTQDCVNVDSVCCGDPCIAYCYTGMVEAPDPYDCTKFYLCPKLGLPDELNHQSCPSGSNFDVAMGHCVAGAPCNTLCSDTSVPGSSTTPSSVCLESMTCTSVGLFPKCTGCDQQYFNCHNVGQQATIETCTGSLLFNTDPDFPYCVQPSDCLNHPAL